MLVTELGITVFLHPATKVLKPLRMIALQLSLESKVVLSDATDIVSIKGQFWKGLFPMYSTELGIVMEVKLEQPEKALFPMLLTELGIVMEVKLEQPWKAKSPILYWYRELGKVMEVRSVQL